MASDMPPVQSLDVGGLSSNAISDFGPILALFGEQVAKQYMSQSMGWVDNIIFAMAPLGIITAIVGAIRVGGSGWLRAIIGRARENRAMAEVELMSSTSHEVCEMWNGQNIVRIMGGPKIREIIFDAKAIKVNTPNSIDRHQMLDGVIGGPNTCNLYTLDELYGTAPDQPSWIRKWLNSDQRRKAPGDAVAGPIVQDPESAAESPVQATEKNTPQHQKQEQMGSAPNISLNLHSHVNKFELYLVAIFGTVVQTAVLVYAHQSDYNSALRERLESTPVAWAWYCTLMGTIGVVVGMLCCSYIIDKSTIEERYPVEGHIIWLQKGETVNDQVFHSHAIFANEKKSNIMTSRRNHRLVDSNNIDSRLFEYATTASTLLSLFGFIFQFMGLRGMHWSVSVAQVGATMVMTGLRAIVRRGLSECPRSQQLPPDHEMDWLAVRVSSVTDRARLWGAQETTLNRPAGSRWRNLTWRKTQLPYTKKETDGFWGQGCYSWGIITGPKGNGYETPMLDISGLPAVGRHSALEVVQARIRLGYLTRWPGGYSDEATSVAAAIEIMMNNNVLRDFDPEEKGFSWYMTARFQEFPENIKFAVHRNKDGEWKADLSEIEAVLSLWMFSVFEKENTAPNEDSSLDERDVGGDWLRSGKASTRKGIRLLGSSTPCLRRDIKWWTGNGAKAVAEIDLSQKSEDISESRIKISDDHKIVGFGGAELSTGTYKSKILAEIPIIEISLANEVTPPPTGALNGSSSHLNTDSTNNPSTHVMPLSSSTTVLGTGAVINLEKPRCCLATISEAPVAMLFSQEMFSAFLWAFAGSTRTKQLTGKTSVVESTLSQKERWQSVTLQNDNLTSLIQEIGKTGLGTFNDIYMSIIPPFSAKGKLPDTSVVVEYINDQAKKYQLDRNWEQAANMYLWTFRACSLGPLEPVYTAQHPVESPAPQVPVSSAVKTNIQHPDSVTAPPGPTTSVAPSNKSPRPESTAQVRATAAFLVFLNSWRAEIVRFRGDNLEQAHDPSRALAVQLARYAKALHDFQDVRIMRHLERLYCRQGLSLELLKTNQGLSLSTEDPPGPHRRDNFSIFDDQSNDNPPDTRPNDDPSGSQSNDNTKDSQFNHDPSDSQFELSGDGTCHLTQQHQAIFEYLLEPRVNYHTDKKDVLGWTPLHYAASIGYEEWIEKLLKDGADWRSEDLAGRTPLHSAAENRRIHLEWTHIRSRVNVNAQAYDGFTPLHCAARSGNEGMAQLLLQSGADLHIYDRSRKTALHWAAYTGSTFIVQQLLRSGANREASDEFGRTPLELAAMQGFPDVVECMVRDATEKQKLRAMHFAVLHDRVEVLQVLFEHGTCIDGCTGAEGALHIAANLRNGEISITFLSEGECVSLASAAPSNHSSKILHMTVDESNREIANIMLENQQSARSARGSKAALHDAIENGRVEPIKLMLFYGANPDASYGSLSALAMAVRQRCVKIVNVLLKFGANPDAEYGSQCALHAAVQQNSIDMVKLLLKHGADANGSRGSETALDLASRKGRVDIVHVLMLYGARYGGHCPDAHRSFRSNFDSNENEMGSETSSARDATTLPFDTGNPPSDTEDAPSDTEDAPSDTENPPSDTEDAPSDTEDAPSIKNSDREPYIFPDWQRGTGYALLGLIEHEHGNSTKVQLLFDIGANPDIADGMPLMLAISKENEELMRLLLKHGATPDRIEDWGHRPIIRAVVKKGNIALVKILVDNGVNPCQEDYEKLIIEAIAGHHVEMIKFLMDYNEFVTDGNGLRTAGGMCDRIGSSANRTGNAEVIKLVFNYITVDPRYTDDESYMPRISPLTS